MVRAWFGHGSGVVRAWFGRGSGAVRARFGHGSGMVRARSGGWFFLKTAEIVEFDPISSFLHLKDTKSASPAVQRHETSPQDIEINGNS